MMIGEMVVSPIFFFQYDAGKRISWNRSIELTGFFLFRLRRFADRTLPSEPTIRRHQLFGSHQRAICDVNAYFESTFRHNRHVREGVGITKIR